MNPRDQIVPVGTPTVWPFPARPWAAMPPKPEVWFKALEEIRYARQAALDAALKGNFPRAAEHAARIEAAARELAAILAPTTTEE